MFTAHLCSIRSAQERTPRKLRAPFTMGLALCKVKPGADPLSTIWPTPLELNHRDAAAHAGRVIGEPCALCTLVRAWLQANIGLRIGEAISEDSPALKRARRAVLKAHATLPTEDTAP